MLAAWCLRAAPGLAGQKPYPSLCASPSVTPSPPLCPAPGAALGPVVGPTSHLLPTEWDEGVEASVFAVYLPSVPLQGACLGPLVPLSCAFCLLQALHLGSCSSLTCEVSAISSSLQMEK